MRAAVLEGARPALVARHRAQPGRIARTFRMVVGLVYLLGAPTHVYFGLLEPDGYRGMSEWSPPITDISRTLWESWFLPNARYLALVLAAGELAIAALIFSRGRWVQLGFALATTFHVALAALFGMWVYTVPMTIALGYMTAVQFSDGPVVRLFGPRRRADQALARAAEAPAADGVVT